jgi:lipopolysaccharide export system permease protein
VAISVLRRYVARELVMTAGVITFVLMLIVLSARLIVYLNKAATGELSTQLVFSIIGYHLPFFLQLILPLGYFIGLLLVTGRMYAENEMVVLNACGIGPNQVLKTIALPTIIVTLLSGCLSLGLSPWGAAQVDQLLDQQKKQTDLKFISPGRFTSLGKTPRVTYTEKTVNGGAGLAGIFVGSPDGIVIAESAHQQQHQTPSEQGSKDDSKNDHQRFLTLENGYQLKIDPTGKIDLMFFNEYAIKVPSQGSIIEKSRQEAKSTLALMDSSHPKDIAQLELRIAMILMVPIAALLAFPLAKVQPRQGRFARLLPAILLYVVYYSAIILATSLIADGKIPPETGVWWVHLSFFTVALALNLWPSVQSYLMGKKLTQQQEVNHGTH